MKLSFSPFSSICLGTRWRRDISIFSSSLYPDSSIEDPFLAALAEGGFQVGALARLYFPDGVMVDAQGHDEAVRAVCAALRRGFGGFNGARPMGSFLFLGPTGVGKTELVKILAEFLFGRRETVL